MRLTEVRINLDYDVLYKLLQERTPEQSISHKEMPTKADHIKFIASQPYEVWYLIQWEGMCIGSIYLSKQREIGINIFSRSKNKGHGTLAVKMLMELHPGKFYANINPLNYSARMFLQEQFGAKLIQNTYEICL